jgi:hypothetical protein
MTTIIGDLVPEQLWQAIQPLLPAPPPRDGGRPRIADRAGVWQRLHQLLLEELGRQGQLDWSRASLDSVSVRAKRGAA